MMKSDVGVEIKIFLSWPESALQIGNIPGSHIAAEEWIHGGNLVLHKRIVQDFCIMADKSREAIVEPRRDGSHIRPVVIGSGCFSLFVKDNGIFLLTQKAQQGLITN